jgi:hypothetical protein
MKRIVIATALVALALPAAAQDRPYAGQQDRAVSTLSADDIGALRAGEGWGLAKPAELNGVPGPAHVLELADELALTDTQHREIRAIFERMQAAAIEAGEAYIAAEQALDAGFVNGEMTPQRLSERLDASARALAALRQVHLSAHLETAPLLTRHQTMTYNRLRGYGTGAGHAQGHGHGGHAQH